MLEKFENAIKSTFENENVFTENGAVGYKTTGKALVDFNFKMSSYRNLPNSIIIKDFCQVYEENALLAMKMLFFTGDIREGMGERRVFNICMDWVATYHPEVAKAVMPYIAEYNRWDSLINLFFNNNTKDKAFEIVSNQLNEDIKNYKENKPISLLAKWMPSINTSSKDTVKKAQSLMKKLKYNSRSYRKCLADLRKYLDVVEVKMSKNFWFQIDYNKVPSKANLRYAKAFLSRDYERRNEYLMNLKNGTAKINSSVAFPYEIIHNYSDKYHKDTFTEEMWKALPDYVGENGEDTICVVDGSGSMMSRIGTTQFTCMDVARSLGIYFAEKMNGAFNNKFITFSRNPKLITFKKNCSLYEKIQELNKHSEVENTDIEKVFDLILTTAINNNLSQNDLPKNILILSDMEFDSQSIYVKGVDYSNNKFNAYLKTLFEKIGEKYKEAGYKLPRLIFWNICSRSNAIPFKENELGVALISGFSPTIASMVFSNKLDPYQVLIEKLMSPRYDIIEKSIKNII